MTLLSLTDPQGQVKTCGYTTDDRVASIANANHAAFSYDADGELVADASRKYAWDAQGRLVGIGYLKDSSVVTTMRYDGLGRRIAIGTM